MLSTFDKQSFSNRVVAAKLIKGEDKDNITQDNLASKVKEKLILSVSDDFETLEALSNRASFYTPSSETEKKLRPRIKLGDCTYSEIAEVAKLFGWSPEEHIALLVKEGGYLHA